MLNRASGGGSVLGGRPGGGFGANAAGGGGAPGQGGGFGAARGPAAGGQAAAGPDDHELACPPAETISAIDWTPPDCAMNLVGCSSWDKSVRCWNVAIDANTGVVQSEPFGMMEHHAPVLDLSFSRDGRVFYGGCCSTAMQWNLADNSTSQVAAHDLPVSSVNFVEDNVPQPMLVTTSWDGKACFWDARTPAPQHTENFGLGPIVGASMKASAPMATFLFARGFVVYNLQNMAVHERVPVNAFIKHGLRTVSNFADCRATVVCSSEGRLAIHPIDQSAASLATCFKVHMDEATPNSANYVGHQANAGCVHPACNTVFTGGSDGLIRVWNMAKKTRIYQGTTPTVGGKPVPVTAGSISPDGFMFAYGVGYDWSLGKGAYRPGGPIGLMIKPIQNQWINPT